MREITIALSGRRKSISTPMQRLLWLIGFHCARGKKVRLRSGGSTGTDDLCAAGANSVDPRVLTRCQPWKKFNEETIVRGNNLVVLRDDHLDWWEGAAVHHEKWTGWPGLPDGCGGRIYPEPPPGERSLSSGGKRLLARNTAILDRNDHPSEENVDLLVAFPDHRKIGSGGTGHTIRMARSVGIPVVDLEKGLGLEMLRCFLAPRLPRLEQADLAVTLLYLGRRSQGVLWLPETTRLSAREYRERMVEALHELHALYKTTRTREISWGVGRRRVTPKERTQGSLMWEFLQPDGSFRIPEGEDPFRDRVLIMGDVQPDFDDARRSPETPYEELKELLESDDEDSGNPNHDRFQRLSRHPHLRLMLEELKVAGDTVLRRRVPEPKKDYLFRHITGLAWELFRRPWKPSKFGVLESEDRQLLRNLHQALVELGLGESEPGYVGAIQEIYREFKRNLEEELAAVRAKTSGLVLANGRSVKGTLSAGATRACAERAGRRTLEEAVKGIQFLVAELDGGGQEPEDPSVDEAVGRVPHVHHTLDSECFCANPGRLELADGSTVIWLSRPWVLARETGLVETAPPREATLEQDQNGWSGFLHLVAESEDGVTQARDAEGESAAYYTPDHDVLYEGFLQGLGGDDLDLVDDHVEAAMRYLPMEVELGRRLWEEGLSFDAPKPWMVEVESGPCFSVDPFSGVATELPSRAVREPSWVRAPDSVSWLPISRSSEGKDRLWWESPGEGYDDPSEIPAVESLLLAVRGAPDLEALLVVEKNLEELRAKKADKDLLRTELRLRAMRLRFEDARRAYKIMWDLRASESHSSLTQLWSDDELGELDQSRLSGSRVPARFGRRIAEARSVQKLKELGESIPKLEVSEQSKQLLSRLQESQLRGLWQLLKGKVPAWLRRQVVADVKNSFFPGEDPDAGEANVTALHRLDGEVIHPVMERWRGKLRPAVIPARQGVPEALPSSPRASRSRVIFPAVRMRSAIVARMGERVEKAGECRCRRGHCECELIFRVDHLVDEARKLWTLGRTRMLELFDGNESLGDESPESDGKRYSTAERVLSELVTPRSIDKRTGRPRLFARVLATAS